MKITRPAAASRHPFGCFDLQTSKKKKKTHKGKFNKVFFRYLHFEPQ
jgi:hypothetical protein